MLSDYDRANVQKILNGHGNWFSAQLLRLIAKSDTEHKEKIRLGFPEVVEAYENWYWKIDIKEDPPQSHTL